MSINISTLTLEELCQLNQDVVALIKVRRSNEARAMRSELSLGDIVNVHERHRTSTGRIKRIMRTRALVEINGRNFKVPMSMLSHKE